MNDNRPSVPSAVKRQLRQESGFGCCHCGHPFVQYHHIVPWAEDQHFRPEDMMVLCGQCHPLCGGAIGIEDQRKLKSRPKNIVDGQLRGKLWVNANELVVHIGGGVATETPTLLNLGGIPTVGAKLNSEDGRVLVSAKIHGSNGQTLATLLDNEWSMNPVDVWDFEASAQHATIRLAPKEVAFSVDARNDEIFIRGKWFYQGLPVIFDPKEVRIGSNRIIGSTVSHCGTMIMVG